MSSLQNFCEDQIGVKMFDAILATQQVLCKWQFTGYIQLAKETAIVFEILISFILGLLLPPGVLPVPISQIASSMFPKAPFLFPHHSLSPNHVLPFSLFRILLNLLNSILSARTL